MPSCIREAVNLQRHFQTPLLLVVYVGIGYRHEIHIFERQYEAVAMLLLLFQLAVSLRPECQEQLRWISGGAQTEVSLIPRERSLARALELTVITCAGSPLSLLLCHSPYNFLPT